MDKNILYKDLKNPGGFKTRILRNLGTGLDKNSFTKLERLLNNLTDALFIPLSRGVRLPAHAIGGLVYDQTADIWVVKNTPYNSVSFLTGVDHYMAGSELRYLDTTVNTDLVSKSDISAIFFVKNTTDITAGEITADMVVYPRIDRILNDNTIRIAIEGPRGDDGWGWYKPGGAYGNPGQSFTIEGIFQSNSENTDRVFYTPGVPYLDLNHMSMGYTQMKAIGYTYSDLEPDGSRTLWATKIRIYVQEWEGDCSSGYGVGDYFYSEWESFYTAGLHESPYVIGLDPDTQYKVYVQIDAKVGPDMFDGTALGCYQTKPTGHGGGDVLEG